MKSGKLGIFVVKSLDRWYRSILLQKIPIYVMFSISKNINIVEINQTYINVFDPIVCQIH